MQELQLGSAQSQQKIETRERFLWIALWEFGLTRGEFSALRSLDLADTWLKNKKWLVDAAIRVNLE